jgi:tripartite-type tricarboxylate transporter receptor subunit TctC
MPADRSAVLVALIASILMPWARPATAQTYPAKPIRVVSTQTAGSPADVLMRVIAQKMSQSIGQPVIVDVQAGAAGVLAAQTVARAAPDGYTVLYTLVSTMVITPQLMKNRPFELKDFTPLVQVSKAATCMLAAVSFPPNSVKEFIDYAKANPGKLAYGTNGIGGIYHLEMEMLKQRHGFDITHVPYKAGVDALMAAVNGTLPIAYSPCAPAQAQARAGKVKILAVLEHTRLPGLPELPAMGEQVANYEKMASGVDMYGPAGMPPPVVSRVHAELSKALGSPEVLGRMKEIAFFPDGTALEQMAAQRRKDWDVMARAIKAAGLKPE